MDVALKLKIDIDNGNIFSEAECKEILENSKLVKQLTSDFSQKPMFLIWRLICLSEIPQSKTLDYTQKIIKTVYDKLATPFGFSLSGDEKMFLPCYNAMIASALCKLGRAQDNQVITAIEWIVKFQPMTRDVEVNIPTFRFDRFGGCFRKTPCYIGVAKSVFALHNYQQATNDLRFKHKLVEGTEYILKHKLFKRLNSDKPITNHILDISYPETYHLNIVELIRFAAEANVINDERAIDAISYINRRKRKNNTWNVNFRYKADGYKNFDAGRDSGKWVTYLINKSLNKKTVAG